MSRSRPPRPVPSSSSPASAAPSASAPAIALRLAEDGWDVATTHWTPYDDRMPWGRHDEDPATVAAGLAERGARTVAVQADLSDVRSPAEVFDAVNAELGPGHRAGDVPLPSRSTRACSTRPWRASTGTTRSTCGRRGCCSRSTPSGSPPSQPARGRVVALTSDHVVHNLPYGATKGALDRLVVAAARELQHLRLTANVVNPGPVDTGWMSDELPRADPGRDPARPRRHAPRTPPSLVSFLLSPDGGWVNGQVLCSDGGLHA